MPPSKSWVSERLPMRCGSTSVSMLSCAAAPAPRHAKASPNCEGSITIFAKAPDYGDTWRTSSLCSAVSVVEVDIADQRSSKLAAGSVLASTVRSFNMVVPGETTKPSVQVACDLMVAAVAATASRATATNPVIVRCLVIRTSCGPKAPQLWVTGTSRRFNGNATRMDCANPQTDNEAVPNSNR